MSPVIAAAVLGAGFLSYKGNMAAARAARQTAEYNAQVEENEAVLLQRAKIEEENQLRQQANRLEGLQRVATAKSGITMSGSPMQALADTYFNTELDALKIQYASSIEQTQKVSAATLLRAEGAARSSALRTRAYQSLLEGGRRAMLV
tara:strand:- start:76 stop:519 length:444 start_codon:yes stop_codon:yes gene_type:complete